MHYKISREGTKNTKENTLWPLGLCGTYANI